MSHFTLSIQPQEATKLILKKLPSRRMRDVLEKRFGLKGGKRHTLEAIGKEYRITRERVRQIEADALKQLGKSEISAEFEGLFRDLEGHLKHQGGVVAEHDLFTSVAGERGKAHVAFLLALAKGIYDLPETNLSHKRWTADKDTATLVEKTIERVVRSLEERQVPVSAGELETFVSRCAKEVLGKTPEVHEINSYILTSRLIRKNPYGEYGLVSWSLINPRGVKDKAHAVLVKEGKPLHFREVARAIDRTGWSKRKAHPQTVHNELIKDPRFVLVGRGLYALKEWGYEPGVVRDVMASVIKNAGRPLAKEDVIRLVSEKRLVKPQTIALNLQNKSLFRRDEGGKYTLA